MCGIAGFTGPADQALLRKMTDRLAYRGPDAEGFFYNGKINFGHRRLSIIDLAGGQQPMRDRTGDIVTIFNGEIYNFEELKKRYAADYGFTTNSDTEVILALYEKKGLDFIPLLNGMFAIALWDERKQTLILIRDRCGKKPLYYYEHHGQLYFASEPKALLVSMSSKPELNLSGLSLFLNFQYLPGEHSVYQGFKKLLPGHYAVWEAKKLRIAPYWSPQFNDSAKPDTKTLNQLLSQAVGRRLVSDVPLGVFLSGGIDSSTVAYYAQRQSQRPVKTFSIGFEEASFDESKYFNAAARFLGTDHHHQTFSSQALLEVLPKILELQDEPLADASILPTYLLSRFARRSVTVAVGGDGADELFAGYPTFAAHGLADWYARLPRVIKKTLTEVIRLLPVRHNYLSFDFKLKQFLRGADESGFWRDLSWTNAFSWQEQAQLLRPEIYSVVASQRLDEIMQDYFGSRRMTGSQAVLYFWQKGYMIDQVLSKVDRASMYNSLEVRAPFLDVEVVEYVNNLPFQAKLRHGTSKYLLKQLMQDKLPDIVVNRPKKGFGIPLSQWLNDELRWLVDDSLRTDKLAPLGLFNVGYVERLRQEHEQRKADHRFKLWTLITFVQMYRRWLM